MSESKVLIVDDDSIIQLLLRVNMEMEGFAVGTASDGEEGLRLVDEFRPDIVLLDVVMPKLDGFEVLSALRSKDSTTKLPVILLSAKTRAEEKQAGIDAGADRYVTKPFDPFDLVRIVKDLLTSKGWVTNEY